MEIQEEMNIDLTLAVNYAPAVVCLFRLSFFLFLSNLMKPGEEIGCFSILAMILWLDRVMFKVFLDGYSNLVFDSNALLMAVFFSHIIQFVRQSSSEERPSFFSSVIFVWWISSCLMLILEPLRLRKIFERRHRCYHVMPACLTVMALLALIRVKSDSEEHGMKFVRGYTFAILSIVWIYVVGLHQFRSAEPLRDNSSHFISRFAPILYTPPAVMAVFAVLAVGCIFYQYYATFMKEWVPLSAPPPDVEDPLPPPVQDKDYNQEDLEEIFRKAKAIRSA